jgi:hypothetical protein
MLLEIPSYRGKGETARPLYTVFFSGGQKRRQMNKVRKKEEDILGEGSESMGGQQIRCKNGER